ncbi:MAG: signal peptidase I [Candidatus Omnitrophica bacterium]|nr:signal peptidase I [Candidatus Omnitrophota bacterium]
MTQPSTNSLLATQHCPQAPLRRFLRGLERCFAVIGLFLVIYLTGFDLTQIISQSMSPTLQGDSTQNGDWVLTDKISYHLRDPKRWEVVAFRNEIGLKVMKRVVGLPGEKVSIVDGGICINGETLPKPESLSSIEYLDYGLVTDGESVDCGDGFFVLGDRSADSEDSRFVGPISWDQIEGRAWMVLWPFARLASLNV